MTLTSGEIDQRLRQLNGWTLEGQTIRKQFTFPDFPRAIAFINRLVPGAEAADHHPDISVNYRRVTLSYTTHSENALTARDFEGAAMADRAAVEG